MISSASVACAASSIKRSSIFEVFLTKLEPAVDKVQNIISAIDLINNVGISTSIKH